MLCHVSVIQQQQKNPVFSSYTKASSSAQMPTVTKKSTKKSSSTMSRESLRISKYPGVIKDLHTMVSDTLLKCMVSHLSLVLGYIVLHHYSDSLNIYLCLFKVRSLLFNTLCCNFIHLGPCLYMIMCLLFSFQCW